MTLPDTPCAVHECTNRGARNTRQYGKLCEGHYSRFKRLGEVRPDVPLYMMTNHGYADRGRYVCQHRVATIDGSGACTRCGFPSIHFMKPHLRDVMFLKAPSLIDQEHTQVLDT